LPFFAQLSTNWLTKTGARYMITAGNRFQYYSDNNTLTFTLGKGWHNVGIVLVDMAGNVNNIQEIRNIHVGFFWLWVIAAVSAVLIAAIVAAVIHNIRKRRKKRRKTSWRRLDL